MQELERMYLKQKKIIGFKKETETKIQAEDLNKMCSIMNLIAVEKMKVKQYDQAENWLNRSIKYAKFSQYLLINIQNNLACLYKKQKNYGLAILHLQNAEQLIGNLEVNSESYNKLLSNCLINMCSVLSAMKQHSLALKSIHKSILLLKDFKYQRKQISQIYSVAKFNEAIQLQHLRRYQQSIVAYQQTKKFILETQVSLNLIPVINSAIESLKVKIEPHIKRNTKSITRTTTTTPRKSLNHLKIIQTLHNQNANYQSQQPQKHFKSLYPNYQTQSFNPLFDDKKNKIKQKKTFSIKMKKSTLENIPPPI